MSSSKASTTKTKRMVPLRYVLMPFAIIFVAIALFSVFAALAPKPEKKPVVIKTPLVEVQAITQGDVQFAIASQGSVMPRTETTLISEVSGAILAVSEKFQVGGFFKQGEVLLTIDDISYQVALLKAQARLDGAKAKLVEENARAKQAQDEWLMTGKSLSDAPVLALRTPQLQQAKADLLAAEADFKEAEIKLARTKIIAPYDAMVKAKMADIGQYVTVGSQLAKIFAVDYAEVRLPIKLHDVPFLNLPKLNQSTAEVSKVALFYQLQAQAQQFDANLTRYEGVVDDRSRVHYVVAQLDDPYNLNGQHQELRIGSYVNASISSKVISNAIKIPRAAVQGANGLNLVDSDNKLHIQTIDIIYADSDYVYSQDAIAPDLRLVLTKLESPVVGMALRVAGENSENSAVAVVTDKGDSL